MEKGVLLGTKTLVKSIFHYIHPEPSSILKIAAKTWPLKPVVVL